MLQSKEFVNPKALAGVFKQICQEGHTGVFQAITAKADVLSFDVKEGKVVNIRYRTKQNKEALKEIGLIEKGKYAFYERNEVKDPSIGAEIPTNEEVFRYLLGKLNYSSSNLKNTLVDNNIIDPKKTLSDSTMAELKKTLTDHIGPISKVVCKEVFEKTADINTAISMLEEKIPDANHAQAFKEKAEHLLVIEDEEHVSDTGELNKQLGDYLATKLPSDKGSAFIKELQDSLK